MEVVPVRPHDAEKSVGPRKRALRGDAVLVLPGAGDDLEAEVGDVLHRRIVRLRTGVVPVADDDVLRQALRRGGRLARSVGVEALPALVALLQQLVVPHHRLRPARRDRVVHRADMLQQYFRIRTLHAVGAARRIRLVAAEMEVRWIPERLAKFADERHQELARRRISQAPVPAAHRLEERLVFRMEVERRVLAGSYAAHRGVPEHVELRHKRHAEIRRKHAQTGQYRLSHLRLSAPRIPRRDPAVEGSPRLEDYVVHLGRAGEADEPFDLPLGRLGEPADVHRAERHRRAVVDSADWHDPSLDFLRASFRDRQLPQRLHRPARAGERACRHPHAPCVRRQEVFLRPFGNRPASDCKLRHVPAIPRGEMPAHPVGRLRVAAAERQAAQRNIVRGRDLGAHRRWTDLGPQRRLLAPERGSGRHGQAKGKCRSHCLHWQFRDMRSAGWNLRGSPLRLL